jgi:hypothetical protein
VSTREHKKEFLQKLAAAYRTGQEPSLEALRQLVELCRDPQGDLHESALTLLLTPPLEGDLNYLRRLLDWAPALFPHTHTIPLPLLEFFLDLLSFFGEPPGAPDAPCKISCLLEKLPPAGLELLCRKPLPLRLCLLHLPVRSVAWLEGSRESAFKRRWRLLCKVLLNDRAEAYWGRLTTRDLAAIWSRKGRGAGCRFPQGRYRQVAGSLICHPRPTGERGAAMPGTTPRASYWNGAGSCTMNYWEALIRRQAEELLAVRELARRVSETTGRVVLSWHNATLAAASGWAFELMPGPFQNPRLRQDFHQAVEAQVQAITAAEQGAATASGSLHSLWELWEKRLVLPKIKHALLESRFRSRIDPALEPLWQEDLRAAASLLDAHTREEVTQGRSFGWCGGLSPHQRLDLREVLAWRAERQACWQSGLASLAAFLRAGQGLLDAGHLPCLVLPWIDKFFISSQRAEDLEYLPGIIDWLARQDCRPLILFWEDTSHRQAPSFQLALKRLRAMGHAFAGLGVFDNLPETVPRARAEAFIGRHHQDHRLFALRPYGDQHHPADLERLIENRHYDFLRPEHYDSAWKDNLCFLYAGTQVFPLLSVQADAEVFAPWVGLGRQRSPFGAYLRRRLRQRVLGDDEPLGECSDLPSGYARWANLL